MFLEIVNYSWRQDSKVFLTYSVPIGQFKYQAPSSMQGLLTNHLRLQKDGRIAENSIKLT